MIGVALMGVSATATAQDGTKADIDAVKNIISSKPADMDKQLNNYYKKNKKNVDNLLGFSKAFYEAKDTARARIYAEHALKANKNSSQAYIMLGDLAALAEDGGMPSLVGGEVHSVYQCEGGDVVGVGHHTYFYDGVT